MTPAPEDWTEAERGEWRQWFGTLPSRLTLKPSPWPIVAKLTNSAGEVIAWELQQGGVPVVRFPVGAFSPKEPE